MTFMVKETSKADMRPYVAAKEKMRELSFRAVFLGLVLAVVFGVGNAFLGLKVGSTVSASIPASVMSMALLRIFFRNVTILENNIVQTTASAGEGLAAGVIFTIPALFFAGAAPDRFDIFLISVLGGVLGVALMVPMREHIIVAEHKKLPFPEGTACAEILKAGQGEKSEALPAGIGLIIGGCYRVCMSVFGLWQESAQWMVSWYQKTLVSLDGTPALLGVGYIIGPRISGYMLSGSILAWWVMIPLIHLFGGKGVIFPATESLSTMSADQIWSNYIRYVGAGAIAVGGLIGLGRIIPVMSRIGGAIIEEFTGKDRAKGRGRLHRDIPYAYLALAVILVCLVLWITPAFSLNLLSVLLLLFFSFLFAAVTSYTVGYVGTSSNPVSGMILTTILITCAIYYLLGWTSAAYLVSSIMLGSVVNIAVAIAADTSQDLKTGHLLGATPMKQQIAMVFGVCVSAIFMGGTVYLLNAAYHFGSMQMPAPQATLLYLVSKGVLHGDLPLTLMGIGAMASIAMYILRVPIMPFAIGIYLPLSLNVAVAVGGLAAYFLKKSIAQSDGAKKRGILFASGLVGGDSIFGVIAAMLTVSGLTHTGRAYLPPYVGTLIYLLIALFLVLYTRSRAQSK